MQLNKEKYPIPEGWNYEGARLLFKEPDVTPADQVNVSFSEPDVEGIVQFLCKEKGFNEERVRGSVAKMTASKVRVEKWVGVVRLADGGCGADNIGAEPAHVILWRPRQEVDPRGQGQEARRQKEQGKAGRQEEEGL